MGETGGVEPGTSVLQVEGDRGAGEEGAASGIPKVVGSGRKRENYATLHNILESRNAKRREPTNTRRELGLKGTGRGRV